MIDREVMQQALEALLLPSLKTERMLIKRDEAITALREALEQPVPSVQSNGRPSPLLTHMMHKRTAPPAAPEQEQTFFCVRCNKNVMQGCFAPKCRPHWWEQP